MYRLMADSDSCADSYDSYSNGYYTNVQKCVHCTYFDSYYNSNSYCTQFAIDIFK